MSEPTVTASEEAIENFIRTPRNTLVKAGRHYLPCGVKWATIERIAFACGYTPAGIYAARRKLQKEGAACNS